MALENWTPAAGNSVPFPFSWRDPVIDWRFWFYNLHFPDFFETREAGTIPPALSMAQIVLKTCPVWLYQGAGVTPAIPHSPLQIFILGKDLQLSILVHTLGLARSGTGRTLKPANILSQPRGKSGFWSFPLSWRKSKRRIYPWLCTSTTFDSALKDFTWQPGAKSWTSPLQRLEIFFSGLWKCRTSAVLPYIASISKNTQPSYPWRFRGYQFTGKTSHSYSDSRLFFLGFSLQYESQEGNIYKVLYVAGGWRCKFFFRVETSLKSFAKFFGT